MTFLVLQWNLGAVVLLSWRVPEAGTWPRAGPVAAEHGGSGEFRGSLLWGRWSVRSAPAAAASLSSGSALTLA